MKVIFGSVNRSGIESGSAAKGCAIFVNNFPSETKIQEQTGILSELCWLKIWFQEFQNRKMTVEKSRNCEEIAAPSKYPEFTKHGSGSQRNQTKRRNRF